jgi:hypothetical protein
MNKIEVRRFVALGFTSLMLTTSAGWAHDDREGVRFQATLQATTRLQTPPPTGRCPPAAIGLLKVVGAGNTNLFGSVYFEQSHCVYGDPTSFNQFDHGCFKLTKAPLPFGAAPCSSIKPLLEGRYYGTLVPTFNSIYPSAASPAPLGAWLIAGNVCTVSAFGRPVSDCSQPPRNYEPVATGISYQDTGAATVFLDQVIRFKQAH